MPVRVRCRCGQELVLRYREWVYVFLGLALLCLILNSVALLLLYLRLEEMSGPLPLPNQKTAPRDPAAAVAPPAPEKPLSSPVPGTSPPAPAPGEREKPPTPNAPEAEGQSQKPPAENRASLDQKSGRIPGEGGESAPAARALTFREPISPLAAEISSLRTRAAAEATGPKKEEEGKRMLNLAWIDEPPLARLYLLEKEKSDLLFPLAFLSDPDARLQRWALDRALSITPATGSARPEALALLKSSAGRLRESARGKKLLEAFGIRAAEAAREEADPVGPRERNEELSSLLKEKAAKCLESAPGRSLRADCAAFSASGMDVVLLVDVSRSMEWGLEGLQRESLWLFPAALWAVPGLRMGLVLYRDDVAAVTGFTAFPGGDLLQLLRDARAEGGGDVPEGVHKAIKAALSLGRFDWRPGAQKHIVLLGDAAPPYGEIEALLSLAGQANRQGGYRFHALSIRPDEGRAAVASYPELALGGGGRAVTVTELQDLGVEIFLSLFSREAEPALRALLPSLRLAFSPEN